MTLNLPRDLEQLIAQNVSDGTSGSELDVVRAALGLLVEHEQSLDRRSGELRAWAAAGFADLVFQFAGSDDRADAALRAIGRSLDLLAERPSMGRGRDWLLPEQLAHPAGGDLIVYRESAAGIEVARISGADRDLKTEG